MFTAWWRKQPVSAKCTTAGKAAAGGCRARACRSSEPDTGAGFNAGQPVLTAVSSDTSQWLSGRGIAEMGFGYRPRCGAVHRRQACLVLRPDHAYRY